MTRHGTSLSLGWWLCSVRAGTQKSLGSAGLKEDPEGVSREGAVLESGDAFSCWPSGVIWKTEPVGTGGLGGGCFAKGIDAAKGPQGCKSIKGTMDGTELI